MSLEAEEVLAMPSEFFRIALECGGRDDPTTGQVATVRLATHAADSSIGSTIDGSSFSGLLTRVEIGHIHIGSAGNGLIRSPGSGSSLSQRV